MASSYYVASQITINPDVQARITAAAQQEAEAQSTTIDPYQWMFDHRWDWGTQADWVQAVEAAQETGITEWGRNPGVITDQHILSYVQTTMAAEASGTE